ncbi:hypothetical protein FisN_3Hh491 [Fistulifera solaris]|uniref:NmrA-like domain-containing protein n=1 Tax=Fistulifera solaris TaxID=1519565 RepID=A0A1Z5K652_FISSO|nr:hypothetical protein FisN_3Hh491 [Fistulifera solaris]|eukprot:GAX21699.1 hypothetical protein FisN_3Hh491 [Fistulifera solaris]
MKVLYFVGATGGLGQEMAKGLATAQGFDAKVALVRSIGEKTKNLESFGWKVQQVDFNDLEGLVKAMPNASVVVTTVSGPDFVDTEIKLINAAKAAGASLYVPSQFGVDHRRWKPGFPFFVGKKVVMDHAEKVGLPTLAVYTGLFSDYVFAFLADLENMTATLVDGGAGRFSFTKRSDIGYVLAKALADPEFANGGSLCIQAETMPWREALALVEEVKGQKFTFTDLTGEEALKQEQELLQNGDMMGSFRLHLLGEPARGSLGCDTSEGAKSYGVELATLKQALEVTLL